MPITCDSCKDYGLSFYSTKGILPINYIEGRSDSKIWIVGLNPSGELHSSNNQENRTLEEFENFHPDDKNKKHKYFHDFKKVSLPLYKNYQSKEMSIVAHTDLVKCFSKTFPPFFGKKENRNKAISAIIKNCYEHLEKQIRIHQPQMIICTVPL